MAAYLVAPRAPEEYVHRYHDRGNYVPPLLTPSDAFVPNPVTTYLSLVLKLITLSGLARLYAECDMTLELFLAQWADYHGKWPPSHYRVLAYYSSLLLPVLAAAIKEGRPQTVKPTEPKAVPEPWQPALHAIHGALVADEDQERVEVEATLMVAEALDKFAGKFGFSFSFLIRSVNDGVRNMYIVTKPTERARMAEIIVAQAWSRQEVGLMLMILDFPNHGFKLPVDVESNNRAILNGLARLYMASPADLEAFLRESAEDAGVDLDGPHHDQ
ncbi:hypothetical protein P7C70_g4369, partial [Phenoliferia sp. Uapishka_3]